MNYRGLNSYGKRMRNLDNPVTRCITGTVILALHVLVIGAIVFWGGGCRSTDKPKERMYKVKLGGSEPSHAPEVGPPERLRPTGDPSPPPPEPAVKTPPKPVPPEPVVKPQPPKPVPAPKEPKVVKPKPREPKVVKPKPREPKIVKPKTPRTRNQRDRQQTRNSREPAVKPSPRQNRRNAKTSPDDGVYRPPGGSNFNPNVRIGNRDPGQKRGPADNRTPMAGKDDAADREWQNRVQRFVEVSWNPPENVFWGDNPPQAVLELVISADGRVLSARLVKPSGNPRMDATIQQLIVLLKGRKAPPPPGGQQPIEVELIPK